MQVIIQHSFADNELAYVYLNGEWTRVPAWIAGALDCDNGGLVGLVRDYGLEKYRRNPIEPIALYRLECQAEALARFYRKGSERHYYNLLSPLHRKALYYEKYVRAHRPFLKGNALYECIGELIGRAGEFPAFQVRGLLEEATELLVWDQHERRARKTADLINAIQSAEDVAEALDMIA